MIFHVILSNIYQSIHFYHLLISRRETGYCKVCWSADAAADVGVSADTNIAKGIILVCFIDNVCFLE